MGTGPTIMNLLEKLGIQPTNAGACFGADGWIEDASAKKLASINPTTGEPIAEVQLCTNETYDEVVGQAVQCFQSWRSVPAPKRGALIRDLGNALRDNLEPLGELVSLEMGKLRAEGIGEVQEMIDICDFAVGLSRQLCGSTMHSERPGHRMYEQWHPLGPIGIVSAFNFPVAVWSWNAALAAVCGDTMVWKPSPLAPLTAIATQHICNRVMADHGVTGLFCLTIGENDTVGTRILDDKRLPLISFTGSSKVGQMVASRVAGRFGNCLLYTSPSPRDQRGSRMPSSA